MGQKAPGEKEKDGRERRAHVRHGKPDGVQRGLVAEVIKRFSQRGYKLCGLKMLMVERKLIGATNPLASEPGTIRGDFCIDIGRNVIHGSDAVESANHEIGLWFP